MKSKPRITQSFVALFEKRRELTGESRALSYHDGREWCHLTWGEWYERSANLACRLLEMKLSAQDRVALWVETSVDWVVADLAIQMAGAITVPVYPSHTAEQCQFIVRDVEARFVLTQTSAQAQALHEQREQLPGLLAIGTLENKADPEGRWTHGLQMPPLHPEESPIRQQVRARTAALTPASICTIVYTSGTTGHPKGVVLTHDNITYECEAVCTHLNVRADDSQLISLPLAHIFPKLLVSAVVVHGGVTVFSRGEAFILEDLSEMRPTIVGSVPGFYTHIQRSIEQRIAKQGALRQRFFRWAQSVGAEACLARDEEISAGWLNRINQSIVHHTIGHELRQFLGGQTRLLISGGAPLPPTVSRFFHSFGIELLEGYGLTETTGATHVTPPGALQHGTVGRPLPGVETRLGEGGEILLRGRNIMQGYYNRPADTQACLDPEGWLHTGDIGEVDDSGYLTITSRKSEIIILEDKQRIKPAAIENELRASPHIAEALLYGQNRAFVTALIAIDAQSVRSWAGEKGLNDTDFSSLSSHPEVYKLIDGIVREVNLGLASFETIRKFAILDYELSEKGMELTPTLKVRRTFVFEQQRKLLDSFYTESY